MSGIQNELIMFCIFSSILPGGTGGGYLKDPEVACQVCSFPQQEWFSGVYSLLLVPNCKNTPFTSPIMQLSSARYYCRSCRQIRESVISGGIAVNSSACVPATLDVQVTV